MFLCACVLYLFSLLLHHCVCTNSYEDVCMNMHVCIKMYMCVYEDVCVCCVDYLSSFIVINLGRTMRERQRVPVKTPVRSVTVLHADPEYICDIQTLEAYVKVRKDLSCSFASIASI